MNHAERRAERDRTIQKAALLERLHGPIREQGVFNVSGCPKCKALGLGWVKKAFCYGLMHETGGIEGVCRREGEHLHCVCMGCDYQWVEHCMDRIEDGR